MKVPDNNPISWLSAAELGVSTEYEKICNYPGDKIQECHAKLEQTSDRELTALYDNLGVGERRTLKAKLYFVAAMLLEQTAEITNKRAMVEKLRKLHKENPLYPSVATIYRTAAPLKVWLGKKCGTNHALSVGDLRKDKKPLLLLTEENIQGIVTECKTARKFAEKYRPKHRKKADKSEPTDPQETKSPAKPADDATAGVVIIGHLTPAKHKKIAAVLDDEDHLYSLNKTQVKTARAWCEQSKRPSKTSGRG